MKDSNSNYAVGIDIGGSHITAAVVDLNTFNVIENTLVRKKVNSSGLPDVILETWASTIRESILASDKHPFRLGIAMPGPFDYDNGISLIKDLHKYDSLYGMNVKEFLSKELNINASDIHFRNDAEAFLAGEVAVMKPPFSSKVMGVTLGTGLGSAISHKGQTQDVNFAFIPFHDGFAEEYISTRWFTGRFKEITGLQVTDVKQLLLQENQKDCIDQLFQEFTLNLSQFLDQTISQEHIDKLIIGGNIIKTADRFLDQLKTILKEKHPNLEINLAVLGEMSAITGAVSIFNLEQKTS